MKKLTMRTLSGVMMAGMLLTGSALATDTLEAANAALETEIQGDVMLISEGEAVGALGSAMVYGTVTAMDETSITLDTTESALTLDSNTVYLDAALGLTLAPAEITVDSAVYVYLAEGSDTVTAIVANIPMDMAAPQLVTVAAITEIDGGVQLTDTMGASYSVVMNETLLNRYVAWNMPATLDLPLPDEIVIGRNLMISANVLDATAPLYYCTMLPMQTASTDDVVNVDDTVAVDEEIVQQVPAESIAINGEMIDQVVRLVDDVFYLPVRAIAEPFDISINWNSAKFQTRVIVDDMIVDLVFGENALLLDDLTYVPLDFVTDVMGLQVQFQAGVYEISAE